MATLTVWKFDTPEGAEQAEATLVALSKEELIHIHDAATVEWLPGMTPASTASGAQALTKAMMRGVTSACAAASPAAVPPRSIDPTWVTVVGQQPSRMRWPASG